MDIVKHFYTSKKRYLRDNSKKVTDPKKALEAKPVYLKCHFVFFDKLKYEITNKVLIFVSVLNLR